MTPSRVNTRPAQLLEKYGETGNPYLAALVVWCCKLRPQAVDDLQGVVQAGQKALERLPDNRRLMHDLGGVLYRAGRFEQAVNQLQAGGHSSGGFVAADWLWLAMTHHRLGNAEQAEHGLQQVDQSMDKRQMEKRPDMQAWSKELELLRAEAQKLIHGDEGKSADRSEPSEKSKPRAPVVAPKPIRD